MNPILKWVGGKRRLLPYIQSLIPEYDVYCEPFLGGGAVFFALEPKKAIVSDMNEELINLYKVVRDDVDGLIRKMKAYRVNDERYYYHIRNLDRDIEKYAKFTDVQRAGRILYLNKTCYNGLYRVNSSGQFNVPFGRYENPDICNEELLRQMSRYLNKTNVEFLVGDFTWTLDKLEKGAFAYLDPPYDPISPSANFVAYQTGGFTRDDQIRLKCKCDELNAKGIKFLASNSSTDFIRELYSDYVITDVDVGRYLGAKDRGRVMEVLIRNY